jgi:hypothetical protein
VHAVSGRPWTFNALTDEALHLAYHGARVQNQSFNITLERGFGHGIASIEVNSQDMTRVLLSLATGSMPPASARAATSTEFSNPRCGS